MKDIPEFEGRYAVTEDGRVWSYANHGKKGRFLKPRPTGSGNYPAVYLKGKNKTIHRLVATVFIENPLNLRDVNHKNGIKTDNRVENLEWCSQLDNIRHAYANGLMPQDSRLGEKNPKSKLTSNQVNEIRYLRKMGWSGPRLGRKYGVHSSSIYTILNGKHWKHVL